MSLPMLTTAVRFLVGDVVVWWTTYDSGIFGAEVNEFVTYVLAKIPPLYEVRYTTTSPTRNLAAVVNIGKLINAYVRSEPCNTVNVCAYGPGKFNAVKETVENLKIAFAVLKRGLTAWSCRRMKFSVLDPHPGYLSQRL
ncbi:hypothetical protein M434DRAFT_32395 [Hypoxylon sp. CO27-5]|nr:hypothetical protein M434DRAFT_32395 [Hypoxylon sp. CO27-5]